MGSGFFGQGGSYFIYICLVAIIYLILGAVLLLMLVSVLAMISRIQLLVRQMDDVLEVFQSSDAQMESAAESVVGDS